MALAKSLDVSPVLVSQWANGDREVPAERCPAIESATGKAVMRWDLRPHDWHVIWPELIGTKGAPKVKLAKAA